MFDSLPTGLRIAFRIAHRARLTHFLGVIVAVLVTACLLAAQFSGRQPATVALDIGFSVIRLLLPVLIVLLLQEFFYREFDRKYFFLSLTYPQTRFAFLLGRGAALLAYAAGALFVLAVVLWLTVTIVGHGYAQTTPPGLGLPYVITLLFIALDLTIVIAVGTLISIAASSASFVLVGTLGFVLCARSFSPIIELLTRDSSLVFASSEYKSSLSLLGYVFPDLARLDVRMIALYDKMALLPADWPLLLLSTMAYALALFCASAWILNRRSFS